MSEVTSKPSSMSSRPMALLKALGVGISLARRIKLSLSVLESPNTVQAASSKLFHPLNPTPSKL